MRAASTLTKTESVDDAALVRAWLEGDADAFEALYQRYFPALVQHLRSRSGTAAEDLAQETMIRALRHIHGHDPHRPLWPWLSRIATNAAIDASRARARGEAVARAMAVMPAADRLAAPADSHLADRDLLRRALGDVPDRQRAALERCYVQGWRPTDVAADFGVGSNAFDQLLHRARRNLRRAYLRHEADEHAAHLGWLAALSAPLRGVGERVRQLGTTLQRLTESVPRLAEGAAATALAGVVILGGAAIMPSPGPDDHPIAPVDARPALAIPADAVAPAPRSRPATTVLPDDGGSPAPTPVAPPVTDLPVHAGVAEPSVPTGPTQDLVDEDPQPQPTAVPPVSDLPVSDLPVSDLPVSDLRVSDLPVSDLHSPPTSVDLDGPPTGLAPEGSQPPVGVPVDPPAPATSPVPAQLDPACDLTAVCELPAAGAPEPTVG